MFESGLRFAVERTLQRCACHAEANRLRLGYGGPPSFTRRRKPPLYAESKSGLKDAINAARYDR